MTAVVGAAPGTTATGPRLRTRRGGLIRAIRHNPKAMAGAIMLSIFTIVAIAPQWFTTISDPNQRASPVSLPPSHDHPLGTTAYGQDVLAWLIWGTRQSLVVAVVVGAVATLFSVLIGVSA